MMNAARLTGALRTGLWAECARTATNLDNIDCDNQEKVPRYKRFMRKTTRVSNTSRSLEKLGS